jgi:hypothetical protein
MADDTPTDADLDEWEAEAEVIAEGIGPLPDSMVWDCGLHLLRAIAEVRRLRAESQRLGEKGKP